MRFIPGPYGCEDLEDYDVGGFHPVHIGDNFNDRYTVVHKLGYGGYATVWLVRDHRESKYAALKILTADSSEYTQELKVYQHLQSKPEDYGKVWAVPLLDSFWTEGPKGRHLCMVFEAMGPSLASFSGADQKKIRPDVVHKVALQTLSGLKELHERGVVYGDLSSGNILFRLVDIDSWTSEEVYEKLGRPKPFDVHKAVPAEVPSLTYQAEPSDDPQAPKFVYQGIDFSALSYDLILPEIRYIDFGEAYLVDELREGFGVNWGYADPETQWWYERPTQSSDIWALACVWYEMRAAEALFKQSFGLSVIHNDIIDTIGALPPSWVEMLRKQDREARGLPDNQEGQETSYSDEHSDLEAGDGSKTSTAPSIWEKVRTIWSRIKLRFSNKSSKAVVRDLDQKDDDDNEHGPSLSQKVKRIGQWKRWCYLSLEERRAGVEKFENYFKDPEDRVHVTLEDVDTGNPPPVSLSEEEAADFEDLLSRMLTLKREDRLPLKEVASHPWLNKDYGKTSEPWLQQFNPGPIYEVHDKGKILTFP